MNRTWRIDRGDERGVVLILSAVAMLAFVFSLAIVVDHGATRSLRRDTRQAADAGAASGAAALPTGGTPLAACRDAFAYTFANLGGTQPSDAAITAACTAGGLHNACVEGSSAQTATLTSGGRTVSVTNPVPGASPLLSAAAVGGGVAQAVNVATDGTTCERLAVEVTRPQARFFGPGSGSYTVHSVARYSSHAFPGQIAPALVTLNRTQHCSIDVGSGMVSLKANATTPGIAYSDSDGSDASCKKTIISSMSSGKLVAESLGAVPGELAWYRAASSVGYNTGSSVASLGTEATASTNYTGLLYARPDRITRNPADLAFNCSAATVPSGTTCPGTGFVATNHALATASTPPAGYTVWSGECSTASAPITLAAETNYWIPCSDGFKVKGNKLSIGGGGTIVFAGPVWVESNGKLEVNVANPDARSYPVPINANRQTTIVLQSAAQQSLTFQSTSASVAMAQTAIYSRGGFAQSSGNQIQWTAPTNGAGKGLMWWSESTLPVTLQGGPEIYAKGVFFHGRGGAVLGGSGLIDLTNVQMWVDHLTLSGSPTVRLAADPENSIKTAGAGTALIR